MPNLLDIRRRIKSVKNTQQITKAMKMVSAAKLRRAQDRVMMARPFANKMTEVMGELAKRTDQIGAPALGTSRANTRQNLGLHGTLPFLATPAGRIASFRSAAAWIFERV